MAVKRKLSRSGRFSLSVVLCVAGSVALSTTMLATSSASVAKKSKSPITLFLSAPLSSPGVSIPEMVPGAKGAADAINAAGGVDGHKINIVSCNDSFTAAGASACAQEAVSDHATGVIGLFLEGSTTLAVLTPAGIPLIDGHPESTDEGSSKDVFALTAGLESQSAATGYVVSAVGKAKNIAVVVQASNIADGELQPLERGVTDGGGKNTIVVQTPSGVIANWSTYAGQALAPGNIQGIALLGTGANSAPFVTAARELGFTGPIGIAQLSTSQSDLASLGSSAHNLLLPALYWSPPAPQANPFVKTENKYETGVANVLDSQSEDAYLEVYAVANALKDDPAVATSAKITAGMLKHALNTAKDLNIGPETAPIDFAAPPGGAVPSLPSFRNWNVVTYTWNVSTGNYALLKGKYGTFFNPTAKVS
jgi:ABC-type branched-subunit amino acid transport system substrate-binding protein